MVAYKEFQAKTLDDAIGEACEYFGVAREKLEIDIVSDAKSGIFGLVGAKKATIRAKRVDLPRAVDALLKDTAIADAAIAGTAIAGTLAEAAPKKKPAARKPKQETRPQKKRAEESAKPAVCPADRAAAARPPAACEDDEDEEPGDARGNTWGNTPKDARGNTWGTSGGPANDTRGGSRGEDLPDVDLDNCDQERLFAVVKEVVLKLVHPIVGDVPCVVSISGSRVRAALDSDDAAGLLVGRDGQTLASVQSLASRIIARQIGGSVRLQVDAGKYRERQDDQIKELALSLALRVKEIGRPLSTRPLTAYQRRIVHLTLEHDEAVQTHSKGEGAQRKVTISPAAKDRPAPQPAPAPSGSDDRPAKPRSAKPKEGQRRGQRAKKPRPDTNDA